MDRRDVREKSFAHDQMGVWAHRCARGGRVPRQADEMLAQWPVESLAERTKVILGAAVQRVERTWSGLVITHVMDGRGKRLETDPVLAPTGRPPVIPPGSAAVGIALDHGRIVVSTALQTSLPHTYAPGDVNGRSMLFHSAVRQSLVAANNIMAGDKPVDFMDFDCVPTTVFTFPQIAYVGVTPSVAAARGVRVVETAFNLASDARGLL